MQTVAIKQYSFNEKHVKTQANICIKMKQGDIVDRVESFENRHMWANML